MLKYNLKESGIDLDFFWGVLEGDSDTLSVTNNGAYQKEIVNSPYRIRLFQFDPFSKRTELSLFFPGTNNFSLDPVQPLDNTHHTFNGYYNLVFLSILYG